MGEMSLQPERHNFSVWKGATFRKVLTLHDGDENSPPKDLSGYTAKLVLRPSGQPPVELTPTLGGVNGTIALFMSDEDTASVAWKTANYGLYLTNPGGDTDQLLFGNFSIKGA